MPSVYDVWLEYTPENCESLRRAAESYCDDGPAKAEAILSEEASFTNLRKWLNQNKGHQKISEENYYRLVLIGLRDGWLGMDTRPLFRSFTIWLGHRMPKREGPRVDHYEVYRYSFLAPGYVLYGGLTITYGKEQVTTEELYKIQSDVAKEKKLGQIELVFPRTGLVFSRGKNSYLMISKRINRESEIQTTFLEEVVGGQVLKGPFSDWHGADFYTGRMYASRIEKPLHKDRICAVKPEEVPASVDKYLTDSLKPSSQGIASGIVSGF